VTYPTKAQGGLPAGAGDGADLRAFRAVDGGGEARALMRSLDDGKALPGMRAAEARMLAELGLGSARAALDVGCGLGSDTIAMIEAMPPGGRVTGVDVSQTMIASARRRVARPGVCFAVGSATALPFPAACFDACRAESVLQHVAGAPRVVAEMARVTRPGGRVVSFEFDLGLTVLDHPDRALTRKILDGVAGAALDGWLGRQVPRFFRAAGFTDVAVEASVIFGHFPLFCFSMRRPLAQLVLDRSVSGRDVVRWLAQLEQAHLAGEYLGGSTAFLVSATRG
jgi:ubiquinone/menaquinone biosynthesis C-methylase UbiE